MSINTSSHEQIKIIQRGYEEALLAKEEVFGDYQVLEAKLNDVRCEHEKLQKVHEGLKKQTQLEVCKYEAKLRTETKRKEEYKTENDTLKLKLRKEKERYSLKEREVLLYQNKADALQIDIKDRDVRNHKLDINIQELQSKFDLTRSDLLKLQNQVNVDITRIEYLEHELLVSNKKVEDDEILLKELSKEKDQLQTTVYELQRKFHAKEDACDKLHHKYSSLQDSEKSYKKKTTDLEYELARVRSKNIQLEKDLAAAWSKPAERQFEVVHVENVQTVEAGPPDDDFSAFDSEELERSNLRIKELEELVHQHEVENSDLRVKLGNHKGQIAKLECELDNAQRYKSVGSAELEGEKGKVNNLLNEIKTLKGRVQDSEKVIEQRKKELNKKDKTIDELKERNTVLDSTVKAKDEELFQLEGKIAELQARSDRMHDDMMEGRKKFGALESELKLSEDDKDGVSGELMSHSRTIMNLESRLEAAEKERHLLEEQQNSLEQKVRQLQDELYAVKQEKDALEGQIHNMSSINDKNRDDATLSRKQMLEHKGTLDGINKEVAEKQDTIDRLRRAMADLNEDLDEAKEEFASARSDFDAREIELKKMSNKVAHKDAEIDRLTDLVDRTSKERDDAEIQLAGLLEKFKNLQGNSLKRGSLNRPSLEVKVNKSPELESQLSALRQKIHSLERENDSQKQSVNFLKSEITDKDDRIAYFQRELDSRGTSDDDSSRRLIELKKRCESLENELEDLRTTKENMDDELDDLRPKVNKLHTQVESLAKQKETFRASLTDTNDRLRIAKEDLNGSEMKLMEQQKANSSLGKMLKKAEMTIEDLTNRLRAAESEQEKLRRSQMSTNATCDALTVYKKELDIKIEEYKARISELESERGEMRDHREAIEGDLGSMSYKLSNLNTKVKSIEKDKSFYQTDSEESQSKLRRLKNELIQAKNLAKEKDRIIEDLTADLKEQENSNNVYKRQKKGLEDDVNTLRKELESQKAANEINRDKINELIGQLESMPMQAPTQQIVVESAPTVMMMDSVESAPDDDRLQDLEALYNSSKDRERALRQEIEEKTNKMKKADGELKKVQEHSIELEHQHSVLQRKFHDAEQAINRLSRERDDCRKDLIEATNQRSLFETRAETEESERRSLQRQLDEAIKKIRASQDEYLRTEENLVRQTLEVRDLSSDKEHRSAEVKRLRDLATHLEEQVQNARASLSVARDANDKLKSEKESMLESNLEKDKANNKLRVDNQQLIVDRERLSHNLEDANAKVEELEVKLEGAVKRRNEAEDEIEELQTEIQTLKDSMVEGQRRYRKQEEKLEMITEEFKKEQEYGDDLREAKKKLEAKIADLERQLAMKSDILPMQPVQTVQVESVESSPMMDFGDNEELQALQEENARLKKRLKEGETEYRVMAEKYRDLHSKMAEYEGKISKHETTSSLSQTRMKEARQELDTLRRDAKPLLENYDSTLREYELLRDEVEDLRSKLSTTELQLDEETTKRKKLRKELDENLDLLHEQDDQIVTLKKNVQELNLLMNSSNDSAAKDNLVATLKNENEMQEREIKKLRREVLHLTQEGDSLQGRFDASEKNLFKSKEECSDWMMKYDSMKLHNDNLVESVKACESKIYSQEEDFQNTKKEKSAMKMELDDTNNKLKKSKAEVSNYKKRVADLQTMIENLKQDLLDRYTSGSIVSGGGSDEELRRLKDKVGKYRDDLQRSQEEVSRLQLQLRDKDIKMSGFDNSAGLLRAENEKLKHDVKSHQAQAVEYKSNYQNTQKDIEKIQLELLSANQRHNHLEARAEALEDDKERYRASQMEAEKEKSQLKIQIDALKHEKNRLNTDYAVLKKKYDAVVAQLNALQGQKSTSKDNAKLKRLTELEALYQNALRDKEVIRNELFAHRKNHAKAENELSGHLRHKDSLEDKLKQSEKINKRLASDLKDVQEGHRADKEEMLKWRKNVKTLEQELASTKHQLDRMKNTKEIQDQQILALNNDINDLNKRIEDLLNEQDDGSDTEYNDYLDAQRKVTELEALLKAVREGKFKADKELQTYKARVWDLEDDFKREEAKVKGLQNLTDETNKMNDKLKSDLAELKKNSWDAQQNYNTVVKEANEHRYDKEMLETEKEDLAKEIRRLRDEMSENRAQKEKLAVERSDLKFQLQRLQVELSQFNMELNETKEDNENLKLELMKATSDNEKLKEMAANQDIAPIQVATVESVESEVPFDFDELDGAKRDRDKFEMEKTTLDNRLRDVEDEMIERQKQKDAAETSLADANKRITFLETEVTHLETARDKALYERDITQKKFIEQRTDNESLKQENETMLLELKDLRVEIAGHARKLAEYEREIAKSGQRPVEISKRKSRRGDSEIQRENMELQKRVSELEITKTTAEERADDAERERYEMERKNAYLREEAITFKSKCEELENECNRLKDRIHDLEDETKDLLLKLGTSAESDRNGEQQNSDMAAKISSLEKRIHNLQGTVQDRDEEIVDLKKHLNEYSGRVDAGSNDLESTLIEIKDKSEIYRKADKAKAVIVEELRAEKTSLEIEIDNLKRDIEDAQQTGREYRTDNDSLQEEINALREENVTQKSKLYEQADHYELKIAELKNDNEIKEYKVEQLEDTLSKYEKQIQELRERQALPAQQSSTTLIFDVDKQKRKERPHSMYVSYTEGTTMAGRNKTSKDKRPDFNDISSIPPEKGRREGKHVTEDIVAPKAEQSVQSSNYDLNDLDSDKEPKESTRHYETQRDRDVPRTYDRSGDKDSTRYGSRTDDRGSDKDSARYGSKTDDRGGDKDTARYGSRNDDRGSNRDSARYGSRTDDRGSDKDTARYVSKTDDHIQGGDKGRSSRYGSGSYERASGEKQGRYSSQTNDSSPSDDMNTRRSYRSPREEKTSGKHEEATKSGDRATKRREKDDCKQS